MFILWRKRASEGHDDMVDQPALFTEPPRDPVRCPRCGWRGEAKELAQVEDEWGACEACPVCNEETIIEG